MLASISKASAQSVWMAWESVFDQITKLRSASVKKYGICKLVIRRHHGKSLECHDGQWIHARDWVGELHLDNRQVLQLSKEVGADRAALLTARMLRRSMKQISAAMDTDPKLSHVKALTGITLLHRGIIHGLGFELHPLESKGFRMFSTYYLRLLLRVLHPVGRERTKKNAPKLVPKMLLMSREALFARYSKDEVA
ncbi:polysaccharide deacetylase [Paenibacillus sp. KQZ6P-2]|uniref:Polysaccharide deacetylase n=1 Tax=Paenibacillus mangrovi TaxID=2931978 RepID=A0A9X2B6T8_9BACL|nr:polysaccharide deacetylase [Paenibacillus mangrovi]MCJ8013098.1 polysaccharide deacetylase [Paenibacillus mangrovi]